MDKLLYRKNTKIVCFVCASAVMMIKKKVYFFPYLTFYIEKYYVLLRSSLVIPSRTVFLGCSNKKHCYAPRLMLSSVIPSRTAFLGFVAIKSIATHCYAIATPALNVILSFTQKLRNVAIKIIATHHL